MRSLPRGVFAVCSLASALFAPAILHALPMQWSGNGHYYDLVIAENGIMWGGIDGASAAAGGMMFEGLSGHLATISSMEENEFIASLPGATGSDGSWIGGFQTPEGTEPYGGWSWVTGETWSYANWAAGEPDDSTLPGVIKILDGAWYDMTGGESLGSYLVEWDTSSGIIAGPPNGVPDSGGTGSLLAASLFFLGAAGRCFRGKRC